jgi:hypothetical protein
MTAPPVSLPPKRYGWSSREGTLAAGVSLLAAVVVVSPFFFKGTGSGHDIKFHFASWLDVAGQWRQGIVFPRWAEWANYGYGEPRFIFYPPLSWLFGALLVLRWNRAASVFIIAVQTFAGWSGYLLLRRLCDGRVARLFGAACFAANPYALLIVYHRSDFAELMALSFFPLLLLCVLTLSGCLGVHGGSFRAIFAFALPFCAIWLSNAPAAVIVTYTAAFLFAAGALLTRSLQPILRGTAGILLGFGLSAFYWIPAFYEQRWVDISSAIAAGLAPASNFLYARTADAGHDSFNHIASNIAVLLLAWAALGTLATWCSKPQARSRRTTRHLALLLGVLTLLVGLLMLAPTSLAWRFLPELRFVQFPWRWMSVAALVATVLMTISSEGNLRWIWLLGAALAIAGSGRYLIKHAWWDIRKTEDMLALKAAIADGSGFRGADEYDPVGDDHTALPLKQPRARFLPNAAPDSEIFVDEWTAERRSLRAITPRQARLAVRLLDYPAWRITVNGHAVAAQHIDGSMQMIVPVAAGESRIEIRFTRTADRVIGGVISTLALLSSLAIWPGARKIATEFSEDRPPGAVRPKGVF